MMVDNKKVTVQDAIRAMVTVCDGAATKDNLGFNRFDTRFAREIAYAEELSYKQEKAGYKMLYKYRKQLSRNFSIDYDEIVFENKKNQKKREKKEIEKKDRVIDYAEEKDKLVIKFNYDADIVSSVKRIPGRRFDGKSKNWFIPLNKQAIDEMKNFVSEYEFFITKKAEEKIEKAKNKNPRRVCINDDKITVKFPYDKDLVSVVKNIDSTKRKWNSSKKRWEFDINIKNCESVINFAEENDFDVADEVYDRYDKCKTNIENSQAESADINIDIGDESLELRPFQKAGVRYALEKEKTFIADEVGLGKTVQALSVIEAKNAFPVLIICPATLKLNWKKEIEKWISPIFSVSINIINGRDNQEIEEADIQIINYDILHNNIKLLKDIAFEGLIVDESHKIKNHKAKRTKAVLKLVEEQNIPIRLLLSATPIKNRPRELISQLNVLGRLDDLGGFWRFANRYCNAEKTRWGLDMDGAGNLDEMNKILREKCFVRREKAEVLNELPEKVRTPVPMEIKNRGEYEDARRSIITYLADKEGEEEAKRAIRAEVLVKINKLKEIVAEGKFNNVVNWVRDFLESEEKLVLFAHHRSMTERLADEFDALRIVGGMEGVDKDRAVERFQNEDNEKLIVISLQAGGEGLTLTESSNVAFAEFGWTPTEHEQAEGRCYGRLNDVHSINSWFLIAENTIEEEILELIEKKEDIFDKAIRGKESVEEKERVLDKLIESLKEEGEEDNL